MNSIIDKIVDAYNKVQKLVEKYKENVILDVVAKSTIGSIPIIGPFLLDWYNSIPASEVDKTKDILIFLTNLKEQSENQLQLIQNYIQSNRNEIIKNRDILSLIMSKLMEQKKEILLTQKAVYEVHKDLLQSKEEIIQKVDNLDEKMDSHDQSKNGSSHIPYIVIDNKQDDYKKTLQKIAISINVQLEQDEIPLPFTYFKDFDKLLNKSKVYLNGRSGCGKSRAIYEILKIKIKNFSRIFVIDPSHFESGELRNAPLNDIINNMIDTDLIIWDRFPYVLEQGQNVEYGQNILMKMSSGKIKNFLVALMPEFLELYNVPFKIPTLYKHTINYDEKEMKKIILSYGKNSKFNRAFEIISQDKVDRISKILWNKEPTPYTVLSYYRELTNKISSNPDSSIDPSKVAEEMLPNIEYYRDQFKILCEFGDRKNEVEFLYALKLSYELGLIRTPKQVAKLQKDLFNSEIIDSQKLPTWTYLSDNYLSMHDMERNAVEFSDSIKLKIIDFISNNFSDIITSENSRLMGLFLGKNISFMTREKATVLLPKKIHDYAKHNPKLSGNMGSAVGMIFTSLEKLLRKEIFAYAKQNIYFSFLFALQVGADFDKIDKKLHGEIFDNVGSDYNFVQGLGQGLGFAFKKLSSTVQKKCWKLATKSEYFAAGLGRGIGESFLSLTREQQLFSFQFAEKNNFFADSLGKGMTKLIEKYSVETDLVSVLKLIKNKRFTYGWGHGCGHAYHNMDLKTQKIVWSFAEKNPIFGSGFMSGLGHIFMHLNSDTRKKIWKIIHKQPRFNYGFAEGLRQNFDLFDEKLINEIFNKVKTNAIFGYHWGILIGTDFDTWPINTVNYIFSIGKDNSFGMGLGQSLGNFFLKIDPVNRERILLLLKNDQFTFGLATGMGLKLDEFDDELIKRIWTLAESNNMFMRGLGRGIGISFDKLINYTKILETMKKSHDFCFGLGSGLAQVFPNLKRRKEVLLLAEKYSELAIELGDGIGHQFSTYETRYQTEILRMVKENSEFERGLGLGFAHIFDHIDKKWQEKIWKLVAKKSRFGYGFGEGLDKRSILSKGKFFTQAKIAKKENPAFVRGLETNQGTTH